MDHKVPDLQYVEVVLRRPIPFTDPADIKSYTQGVMSNFDTECSIDHLLDHGWELYIPPEYVDKSYGGTTSDDQDNQNKTGPAL